jgi:hypothetical protein
MANEIQVGAQVSVTRSGVTNLITVSASFDQTSPYNLQNVQAIGTADEVLVVGDTTNPPFTVILRNLDAMNYVEVDSASTYDKFPQKLLPNGDFIKLNPETNVIHLKAHTSACDVEVLIISV